MYSLVTRLIYSQYVENVIWNISSFMTQDEIAGFILLLHVYFDCLDMLLDVYFTISYCSHFKYDY